MYETGRGPNGQKTMRGFREVDQGRLRSGACGLIRGQMGVMRNVLGLAHCAQSRTLILLNA
ncbi:MAG: hypothetical protein CMM76_17710 [Rhodospirillaceae bacterium]|nr:hypothetical protein [Rhodospirillaceae bacterium]